MRPRTGGSAWWVWLAYGLGGLALGLADPQLGGVARGLGLRPGVATALSVNLLLPALAVALAVARPRPGTAWLGGLGLAAGFVLGLSAVYSSGPRWDLAAVVRSVPPVLVLAAAGYVVLGTVTALAVRASGVRDGNPSLPQTPSPEP